MRAFVVKMSTLKKYNSWSPRDYCAETSEVDRKIELSKKALREADVRLKRDKKEKRRILKKHKSMIDSGEVKEL